MPEYNIPLLGRMGPVSAVDADASQLTDSVLKGAGMRYPYYINGYFEVDKTKAQDDPRRVSYTKRPGTTLATVAAGSSIAISSTYNGYKIQGVVSSLDRTKLLFYLNNGTVNRTAYYDGTTMSISAGNAPAAAGNWTFTGPVVWTLLDGISYGANNYYAVTDFTKGAVVNSTGTWTEITDADFTGLTKVTNFIGLDGYLFIGTSNNRIYNSDLNNATAWTSTSFLTAADAPGALLWLGRIRNYIVAFKQYSLEFFEDTGNPTPGSPLTPQRSLRKNIGLASKSSVQYVGDGIIFLGQNNESGLAVYKLRYDDLGLEKLSDYFVESVLNQANTYSTATTYSVDGVSTTTSALGESQIILYYGKEFYLINVTGINSGKRTYVYDNELKMWVTWDTWFATTGTTTSGVFDPSQAVTYSSTGVGLSYTMMVNNYASINVASNAPFFTIFSTHSPINDTSLDVRNSAGTTVTFPYVWVGDVTDFGSRKRKFLDSLELLIEGPATLSLGSTLYSATLYYRDSNFNDSSTAGVTRTFSFLGDGSSRAIIRRLGSFRKRQFGILDVSTQSLRLFGIQCQFNSGETDQEG